MSRQSLVKGYFTQIQTEEKRVLHTNEIMEQRLAELAILNSSGGADGFTAGLQAETLDMSSISPEQEGENIIKVSEDIEQMKAQAAQEAEDMLTDARAQAEAIVAEAGIQADREKGQVLSQAREQGYQEGMEKAAREAEQIKAQFAQRERELEAQYQQMIDELEPKFIDTLTGIYEHIFHVDLQSHREILIYLIGNTMRKAEGSQGFLVHVSKEDYPYVSMQKKQIMAAAASPGCSIEIVEDMTLAKNACLIETEGGIFDCGLGTQLSELNQKLKLLSYGQ